MTTGGFRTTSTRALWAATVATLTTITILTVWGPWADTTWGNSTLLFATVSGSAVACILAATGVIALADRRQLAELGLLGSALLTASVMPLAHGLLTPGELYDNTSAFRGSAFLSVPLAMLVAAPLFTPHSAFGTWAARRWRDWTLLTLLGVFVLASLVVFYPDTFGAPSASNPVSAIVAAAVALFLVALSTRQLRLFEIGRSVANLVVSISLLLVAVTVAIPLSTHDYSVGFWWLHLAGIVGVAGACVGLAMSKRMTARAQELLEPVISRDPLVAFELSLSPVVHRFVATLDDKDQITRDHVVRTAEIAIRVGERFKLSSRELRDLGLAALLHDVGKLNIPDQILTKPGPLTDDEYEIVKRHAEDGEQMLAREATLASVAPLVRSHHERMDGRGYPDGLVGRQIPLASRIIAVCDAFDAMTNDRQYRAALPVPMAYTIMKEYAGSQWDAAVIDQAIAVFATMPPPTRLDRVGAGAETLSQSELDVATLLTLVDAEI